MQLTNVADGETIFSVGDPSTYVIENGEVAVTVNDGIAVARLHAGELFGEAGVLEKRGRSAPATAVLPTRLLTTDAETFSPPSAWRTNAPSPEQSGRELASADTTARAANATVRIV
jgi:signal-transduction protein with cAMP-binding, CBS, and nucleotidyltransferase domain